MSAPIEAARGLERAAKAIAAIGRPVPIAGGRTGDWVRGWHQGRDEAQAAIRSLSQDQPAGGKEGK